MMRIHAVLLCLLTGLAAATARGADAPDPRARLDAMSRSVRQLDYRGVFTYEQGQTLSSVRIVHTVVDGVEQQRLVHLDGDEREFLSKGHRADCEHAGERLVRSDPAARFTQLPASGAATTLDDHYAIAFDGAERVADLQGSRIVIVPRDPHRYGMTVVLEDASSLLLKSETTDGAGRVIERFQFVDLQIGGPVPAAELDAQTLRARQAVRHEEEQQAEAFAWAVSWLPNGFVATGRELRRGAQGERPVEIQTYTDGLAVFSVFVERGADQPERAGRASRGATVSYVVPRGRGHLVTVVGEIPMATAELIANSVDFAEQAP